MSEQMQLQAQKEQNHQMPNHTNIPTQMKLDFEKRSGLSFGDVRVHYHSDKPARIGALAYTQGNQVYIGPGQERHLRHELGHVVQQKQGLVRPTRISNGVAINDNPALEHQADLSQFGHSGATAREAVVQGVLISAFEFNHDDSDDKKLKYFQNAALGIDQWIMTAYEYLKQQKIETSKGKLLIPALLSKLYSIKEIVETTNPKEFGELQKLAKTENVSVVTHGDKDDDGIWAVKCKQDSSKKTDKAQTSDKEDEKLQGDSVLVRDTRLISKVREATGDNFTPFFCYMGNSKEAMDRFGEGMYDTATKTTEMSLEKTGPGLLPPGEGPDSYGVGYLYNEAQILSAIAAIDAPSKNAWNAIINEDGIFQTVGEAKRYFSKLEEFCNNPTKERFQEALEEIIAKAFDMYNKFVEAVNAQIQETGYNACLDVGNIF